MTDTTHLIRWRTGDAELAYTDSGGPGETMLLMHGGGLADWLTPLAAADALARYRVIRLVRAGYTDAPAPAGLTVADHAAHAAALLGELGAGPAHLVAYSAGSTVALQFTADHPDLVRTLSLCEPPLLEALAAPADRDLLRMAMGPTIGAVLAATARGDLPTAFDTFMTLVCGPGYRDVITDTLGAGALADAENRGYFFTDEAPAVNGWTLPPMERLRVPVLLIQGGGSPPPVHNLVAHLAGLIPDARVATVPATNHLLPLTGPARLARLIDDFCAP
jgi:pimeloyl-ACP methyl ester carboxylesterase